MRVALYARVSDDKLKENGERRQDVQRQTEMLQEFVEKQPWEFKANTDVFIDDGRSAYKEDYQSRPAFTKLLREIRGHHYQRIVVEDMTRWSRRLEDGLRTLRESSESGCTVTSLHEGDIDVTMTEGWARSAIFLWMAEYSSRIQADKVRSGMSRIPPCVVCGQVHKGAIPRLCKEDKRWIEERQKRDVSRGRLKPTQKIPLSIPLEFYPLGGADPGR